ncbi:MAG: Arc family DNA binding domain-containing protein [Xanthomonadales bacterium]|nr:Arc family DNA binding domain-containing protein [Xanthomonadales bacterium]
MTQKKAFPLRINEEIWQAVRRWSDDELRSVNGQIEYLLRDALRKAGRMPKSTQKDKETSGEE